MWNLYGLLVSRYRCLGFLDQVGKASHVLDHVLLDVSAQVAEAAVQVLQDSLVGKVFQFNDVGMTHAVPLHGQKNILHLAPGA